jgi:hypothetical protein
MALTAAFSRHVLSAPHERSKGLFVRLYRRALRDHTALDRASSPLSGDAFVSHAAALRRRDHPFPLPWSTVGSGRREAEKEAEEGEQGGEQAPAPSRPLDSPRRKTSTAPASVSSLDAVHTVNAMQRMRRLRLFIRSSRGSNLST